MQSAVEYFRSWFGRFEAVAYRRPDAWLYLPAAGLAVLGLLMALNTTYFLALQKTGDPFYFFKRHLIYLGVGLLVLGLLSQFSLAGLRRLVMPILIIAVIGLLLTYLPGVGITKSGARRWLQIGPFVGQPSELAKLAVVFFLAKFLATRGERMRTFAIGPLPAILAIAPIALLILKQPDLGSIVLIGLVLFAMLYAAGARLTHLAGMSAVALCIFAFQATSHAYRLRRIASFLDPWQSARGAGFQLIQSYVAFGAGGGWGVGLGASRQKMFYLPQAHNDFVFAVIGEEFGLAGALVVIALFTVILYRGMRIARREPDPFASLLAVGFTALLTLQALVNIAVVIGMIPTKGLPLPLLSYGGSALVGSMAALGVLLALGRRPAVR
jgi:cell division protein FtsW